MRSRDGTRAVERPQKVADTMTERDAKIDFLEQQIPDLARAAVTQAYFAALAAGNDVMVVEDGAIYEISPDGTRRFIKAVEPSIPAEPGTRLVFR